MQSFSDNFLKDNNARHFVHPNAHMGQMEENPPRIMVKGEGVYVEDIDGNRVVDGVAGLWSVNAGYGRREIIDAINSQVTQLPYYSAFKGTTTPPPIALSTKLTELLQPERMTRIFFSSGGSDAVETALKLARQYWKVVGQRDRYKFISLRQGYHGTHFGGMSVNGAPNFRRPYEPVLPGCIQIDTPWLYRNPYTENEEELGELCAQLLEREIIAQGPDTVAAFIAEPVQGAGGVIVPPANYWPRVREICDKYDVLLIADEIVTGFGRSGELFGSRLWGIKPDMMCLAKGLTSGYLPLGATAINEKMSDAFSKDTSSLSSIYHAYTYSGHPVCCAAGLAAVDLVLADDQPGNARKEGSYLFEKLKPFEDRYKNVGNVRGIGLMVAIDMVADKKTKAALGRGSDLPGAVAQAAFDNGAMVRPVGGSVIILSPPLVIQRAEIDKILDALANAFESVKAG
jgi:adenosylmethionine-8-amino-7-oxononanoate aminotransferase